MANFELFILYTLIFIISIMKIKVYKVTNGIRIDKLH